MTVIGIAMIRNEEDVTPYVVPHMLAECDGLLVAENRSTDSTRSMLDALAGIDQRLRVLDEPRFAYRQPETMNRLAGIAADEGASWIVPFDADEWWWSPQGRLAGVLRAMPADITATATITRDMIPQPTDRADPNPFTRIVWSRPGSMWSLPQHRKIAFRPGPDRILMAGNHGLEGEPPIAPGPLRIRHYPFRSLEQAAAKLRHGKAAIDAAGWPPGMGFHWQDWGSLDDDALAAWWAAWTDPRGLV